MQLWLQVYRISVSALVVIQLVFATTYSAQDVLGSDLSWRRPSLAPASTLDAYIPPQNLELRTPISSLVGLDKTTVKQPKGKLQGPALVAPSQPHTKPNPQIKPDPPTEQATSKPIVSPFKKWVSPKSDLADTEPTENTPREGQPRVAPAPSPSASFSDDRVARRINSRNKPVPRLVEPDQTDSSENEIPPDSPDVSAEESTAQPEEDYPEPDSESEDEAAPPTRSTTLPPLSAGQQHLRTKIRSVLTHYYNRPLNTRDRSPWELMHAMLAFEVHSKVLQGGPRGKPITAVGWLCYNQDCKNRKLMYVNDEGEIRVRVGPALQGHRGQLLALLAQSKVSRNYPVRIEGHEFTVADLIKMEMKTCYPRSEQTFKLIALMHYLKSDTTWMNDQGMQWSIPQLIAEELRQPIRGAACGGTHRLAGLTLAYKTRQKRGEPVDGEFLKAQQFVARYQRYAYQLQNRDGSFSTEWFRGPGNERDLDRKLKTTGHLLEWLLYAATEKELHHWKTTKAVNYLASIMYSNRYKDWEAGPLGHAIHALLLYDRLVFTPYDEPGESPIAGRSKRSAANMKR